MPPVDPLGTVFICTRFTLAGLPPHHLVYHAGVALDKLHDLGRHILVGIVWHRDAMFAVLIHLHGQVNRLQKTVALDASQHEAGLVQRLGALSGGADAHRRKGAPDAREEAGLLGQGAGVGHNREGIHLQTVVVVETQRLVLDHAGVELEAARF